MLVDVLRIRHELHAHPSLSGEECYAHDLIVGFLKKLHPTRLWLHVGGYGVAALFGEEHSEWVVFRADIDALPIQESLAVPYKSCVKGVSHKCGHDGHTAIALRLAEKLAERMEKGEIFTHPVLLLFQPAEETGEGSARVLKSDLFHSNRVVSFYGLHNLPSFPKGKLVFKYGTFAAASVGLVLHLKGRQTHAAFPEKGLNPAMAVAEIIQEVLAGNNSPDQEACFHQATLVYARIGAIAFGTSAGDADVMFTMRAFTNSEMERWKNEVVTLVRQIVQSHGLTVSMEWKEEFHATENDSDEVDRMKKLAMTEGYVYEMIDSPFRWSEDFSEYLMNYSGAFFGVGSGEESPELHHPDYDFPDDIVEIASSFAEKLVLSHP